MLRENVHNHGVDLLHMYLVNIFKTYINRLTHVLHVFFTDFDEWCNLRCISDLVWRWRKLGGQYDIVTNAERRVPESASFDVVWTPLFKLPAEVIPKPLAVDLRMGEDIEHTDRCQRKKSRWVR